MSTKKERWVGIEAAVFRTISAEDWRRQLREARLGTNAVRERIRAAARARGLTVLITNKDTK
jgi:hypothetical protein